MEILGEGENLPLVASAKTGEDKHTIPVIKESKEDGVVMKAAVAILTQRNRQEGNRGTPPNPLKVPPKKLFGYPERYKSPTDSVVSPVSRGLLARNRRPVRTLAPFVSQKALENTFQEAVQQRESFAIESQSSSTIPTITL